jgi:hypothetical protein
MASKTKTSKAQTVYALVLYGGVLKTQVCIVKVFTEDPEDEFETYKEYYGSEIKGRVVKCTKALATVKDSIFTDLESYLINDSLYKLSVTEIVKILKKATDAKKCTTMGVYETETDDKTLESSEDVKATKTTKAKVVEESDDEEVVKTTTKAKTTATKGKVKVESDEEVVETKPKAKTVTTKGKAKAKVESDEEVVETKTDTETKTKTKTEKQPVKKTVAKSKKVDLDDDLDDEIEVTTKPKSKAVVQNTKTRIVLSDDDEEEEEN